ncbi:class A beta-lactamase [Novosphingobium profundi]|uniref:class A beta-lactamase n=1 Tax=Novosphingobium profundi TaxID=1774954 RepID=UPI001BD9E0B0|nr:class A beta-lactamase [Novosphingobium profundi]MBT0669060.1 class A beta-lactamase [Novosphingobium profundi]
MRRPLAMLTRRKACSLGVGAALALADLPVLARSPRSSAEVELGTLEKRAGGRLGAFVRDTQTGAHFGWRQHERFTQCSSFKLSLAAMILARGDAGTLDPDRVLHWSKAELLGHAPVTRAHLRDGLSVRDLARAAVIESDNTAANVLLKAFGGPQALTRFWRSLGDTQSRLDRFEPDLNVTPPGTALDTTTPAGMAGTLEQLLFGHALTEASRCTLQDWMQAVATGKNRIRSAFPGHWISGDKTGTGPQSVIDIAFGGPAGRKPLIVTAYFDPAADRRADTGAASAILAQVGQVAVRTFLAR